MSGPETSRDETHCAGPDCDRPLPRAGIAGGRPPSYCSRACRQAAYRARLAERMKSVGTRASRGQTAPTNDDAHLTASLAAIAGLVGRLLASSEQAGDATQPDAALAALARKVDCLARGHGLEPGYLPPSAEARYATAAAVTEQPVSASPAEPAPPTVRTAALDLGDDLRWRLAQSAESRARNHWLLQLDEVTVGVIYRSGRVTGRKGWEVHLHSCLSPQGPWDTRALAALQGIDAHQRHLERSAQGRQEGGTLMTTLPDRGRDPPPRGVS